MIIKKKGIKLSSLWLQYKSGIIRFSEIESISFNVSCKQHGNDRWKVITRWTAMPQTRIVDTYEIATTNTIVTSTDYPQEDIYNMSNFSTLERLLTVTWNQDKLLSSLVRNTQEDIQAAYLAALMISRP